MRSFCFAGFRNILRRIISYITEVDKKGTGWEEKISIYSIIRQAVAYESHKTTDYEKKVSI